MTKQIWVVRDRNTKEVFSYWSSAKKALTALEKYRDDCIIGPTGEVSEEMLDVDGFSRRKK